MKIVAEQWTPVSRPKALSLMEDWMQRFPDLKGVYTANDDLAVGAVEAIKAADKANQIKVSSANPTPLGMKYLKEGNIVGFAIQQTVLQGRVAARSAYNYITQGEVVSKVLTAVLPISKENADSFNYSNVLHPKEFKP
jgi:ABC-type sugar transport system substrate-binding protein